MNHISEKEFRSQSIKVQRALTEWYMVNSKENFIYDPKVIDVIVFFTEDQLEYFMNWENKRFEIIIIECIKDGKTDGKTVYYIKMIDTNKNVKIKEGFIHDKSLFKIKWEIACKIAEGNKDNE